MGGGAHGQLAPYSDLGIEPESGGTWGEPPLTWGQVPRGAQDQAAEGEQRPGWQHGLAGGSAGCGPPEAVLCAWCWWATLQMAPPVWGLPALLLGRGGGFLLNHFEQKLFTPTSVSYKVNHFLYSSFQSAILCKGRKGRKRNVTCEPNRGDLLVSKLTEETLH